MLMFLSMLVTCLLTLVSAALVICSSTLTNERCLTFVRLYTRCHTISYQLIPTVSNYIYLLVRIWCIIDKMIDITVEVCFSLY